MQFSENIEFNLDNICFCEILNVSNELKNKEIKKFPKKLFEIRKSMILYENFNDYLAKISSIKEIINIKKLDSNIALTHLYFKIWDCFQGQRIKFLLKIHKVENDLLFSLYFAEKFCLKLNENINTYIHKEVLEKIFLQ